MPPLSIQDLYVYPVKSMAGTRLETAELDTFGLRHDRRWMLVDDGGRFLTQRTVPSIALVRPSVTPHGLTLDAPGVSVLDVETPSLDAPRVTVQVWNDIAQAVRARADADRWCSDFLGVSCRLVYMPDDSVRPVDPRHAKRGERVHFGDGFPLLVVTQAALDDLNARLTSKGEGAIPMNRFRPNIVIAGATAYAEDRWQHIRVGDQAMSVGIRLVKPCGRCVITTTDQQTATRDAHQEPLRTLATYRKQWRKVMFGQNALHDSPGTIRVGDAVVVDRSKVDRSKVDRSK